MHSLISRTPGPLRRDDPDVGVRERPSKCRTLRQRIGHVRPCGIAVNPALFLLLDVDAADERRRSRNTLEFAASPGKGKVSFAIILLPDASHLSIRDILAVVRRHDAEGSLPFLFVPAEADDGLTVDFRGMNPRMGGSLGMPDEHGPCDRAPEYSLPCPHILDDAFAVPARGSLARFDGLGLGTAEESRAHNE